MRARDARRVASAIIAKSKSGETWGEYWAPEKARFPVTRRELAAVLAKWDRAKRERTWWWGLWRQLKRIRFRPIRAKETAAAAQAAEPRGGGE